MAKREMLQWKKVNGRDLHIACGFMVYRVRPIAYKAYRASIKTEIDEAYVVDLATLDAAKAACERLARRIIAATRKGKVRARDDSSSLWTTVRNTRYAR